MSTTLRPESPPNPAPLPLIGVDDLEPPSWAAVDEQVAAAGFWQTVRALPAAGAAVLRLAWSSSPRLTIVAGVVNLGSGVATAFGLFATTTVFTSLLAAGPTPHRVLASLPAIAVVVLAYAVRASLDGAVSGVQGALRPGVRRAAQDRVNVALAGVPLIVWEDADFRELARQGGRHGVTAIETSVRGLADLSSALVSLVAAMVTAGVLNPWLAPVLLLAAAADAWASMRAAKQGYRSFLSMVSRQLRLDVVENLMVARDVAVERHALALQPTLLTESRRIARDITAESVRLAHRQNATRMVGRALAGIGTGAAYVVLGALLFTGAMRLALAGTAVVAMREASGALSSAVRMVNTLYEDSFYIAFYQRLLTEARQRHRPPTGVRVPTDPAVIRVAGVSFSYPGQDTAALHEVNLTIRRGEVVALVGENGSGKSTLARLLIGLYAPTEGQVCWDDVDLAEADPDTVHRQVAVIAQEPARWPMTFAHNVRIGRLDGVDTEADADAGGDADAETYADTDTFADANTDAGTEADVDAGGDRWAVALRQSGADEVLATLPNGQDTILSKQFTHGADLSGGQWQRVGVARGIYRDAAVLVADEPTAALDAKAEARVFDGLRHASRIRADGGSARRTTILITHRLANIRDADRIVVLDHGRIAEQGDHHELIAANGIYRELFDIQASAYSGTGAD